MNNVLLKVMEASGRKEAFREIEEEWRVKDGVNA
jgi:hypothetical protein